MAEWIRDGYECSECGFRLPRSAKCYEWIERGDHGYLYKNYAVTPAECPKCHNEMTAVVYEGGGEVDKKTNCSNCGNRNTPVCKYCEHDA